MSEKDSELRERRERRERMEARSLLELAQARALDEAGRQERASTPQDQEEMRRQEERQEQEQAQRAARLQEEQARWEELREEQAQELQAQKERQGPDAERLEPLYDYGRPAASLHLPMPAGDYSSPFNKPYITISAAEAEARYQAQMKRLNMLARAEFFRAIALIVVIVAIVATPIYAMTANVDAESFAAYISPVSGIAGAVIGYWFGSNAQRTSSDDTSNDAGKE